MCDPKMFRRCQSSGVKVYKCSVIFKKKVVSHKWGWKSRSLKGKEILESFIGGLVTGDLKYIRTKTT